MNFACKKFDIEQVVKCSLGLTKSEYNILKFLMKQNKEMDTEKLSFELKLDKSTIQRSIKKLHEKKLVFRGQKNKSGGGYLFFYSVRDKSFLRKQVIEIIDAWSRIFKKKIHDW